MSPESRRDAGMRRSVLLGRRSLLKKAAVGGGLALSAPILITSFSPAAACSVPDSPRCEVGLPSAGAVAVRQRHHHDRDDDEPELRGQSGAASPCHTFAVRYPGTTAQTDPAVTGTGVGWQLRTGRSEPVVGADDTTPTGAILYVYQANVSTSGAQTVTVTFFSPVDRFSGAISSADQGAPPPVSARLWVTSPPRPFCSPLPTPTQGLVCYRTERSPPGMAAIAYGPPAGWVELADRPPVQPRHRRIGTAYERDRPRPGSATASSNRDTSPGVRSPSTSAASPVATSF